MDPAELKKELENSTAEYRSLNSDYRQHILKYAISLMAAELAVVGFLLQNTVTQSALSSFWPKAFLLSSLLSALISAFLSVAAKRVETDAEKNLMHSYQYRALASSKDIDITVNGVEAPPSMLKSADKNADDSVRKYMTTTNKVRPLLNWSEYTIIAALFFSVLLVIYLITSI